VQYLAWLAPWTAALTARQALAHHLTTGAFLFSYYDFFSGGVPWYLADTVGGMASSGIAYLGLLCWLVIGLLIVAYIRHPSGESSGVAQYRRAFGYWSCT